MAELWQVPDILHQRYDLISINCSRQTGFSWCNHHGNSNSQFPLVILFFPNMVKYASYIKSRGFTTLLPLRSDTSPNISHSLVSLETYWCQPHYILNYHSNDLSPVTQVIDGFLLPGGILTLPHPFLLRWSQSESHPYHWLPMAWEHIDIVSFIIIPKTSAVVTPIPSASYGLGRYYCFIIVPKTSDVYHRLPTAWEHIIASFIIVPKTSAVVTLIPSASYGLGTHYCFIHYCSKNLSRSHISD